MRRALRDAEASTFHDLLSRDRTPEGLLGALENAIGFAEAMAAKFKDPNLPALACREGCPWCCYQTIGLSAPEAFRLAHFIRTAFSAEDAEGIVARVRKLDNETSGMTATMRDRLGLPCAFLVEKRCTVYSARPMTCAGHTSFDVKACERAQRYGYDKVTIINDKARVIAFHEVQEGVFDGLSKIRPPVEAEILELTAAILIALETADCESRRLAGEKVFAKAYLAICAEDFKRGPEGRKAMKELPGFGGERDEAG